MQRYKRQDGTVFKVGDKVRITSNTTCSINAIGDVGFITELDDFTCRVSTTNDKSEGRNWTRYDEMELSSFKTCETCGQQVPVSILDEYLEVLNDILGSLEAGSNFYTCLSIERGSPKLYQDYKVFIKPFLFDSKYTIEGDEVNQSLNPLLCTREFRIELIKQFIKLTKEKYNGK